MPTAAKRTKRKPSREIQRIAKAVVRFGADLRREKAQATIVAESPSRSTSSVAKKRTAHKRKPDFTKGSLRWKFCMRLRELAKDRDTAELAKILGVSGDLARKYLGGTRVPTLDEFPAIAEAFGLDDWTDLFRPKNS